MDRTPYGTSSEVRIRIGGPAGAGIKAAGQTLARSFVAAGLHTFDLTEYPSLIKGGHNTYHVRVSPDVLFSHVSPTDVLVALDSATVDLHAAELDGAGAIVFDPDDAPAGGYAVEGACMVEVPLGRIVSDAGGVQVMRNIAALGAVLGLMRFPLVHLEESLRAQFASKDASVTAQNVAVAAAGHAFGQQAACDFPVSLKPVNDASQRVLVDGNEAVGLGALAAGVGFYAAYPMTPASSLLHFMAARGEDQGVVVKHTEDELAAMNMVVGAAFGGARAMCATSGGGFSLMSEAFGLAGVSESAVVVGVFTRPGPATGMPTWTEQSDLRFVIHAAQGEFPRVVLAPGDVTEAFDLTWRAFNLADRLQTPVVILGDAYLSDHRQSAPAFDLAGVTIERGELQVEGEVQGYLRYRETEDGVSLRVLPGVIGAQQIVNSYEHDEHGWGAPGEDARVRKSQNEKRMRKLALARTIVPPPARFGPDDADVSVICFGSTKRPVLEAMRMVGELGISVNLLQTVTVWPFPAHEVTEFIDSATRVVVIEGDHDGQLEGLIREQCLREVHDRLRRYDGRPFAPEQVARFLEEVAGRD